MGKKLCKLFLSILKDFFLTHPILEYIITNIISILFEFIRCTYYELSNEFSFKILNDCINNWDIIRNCVVILLINSFIFLLVKLLSSKISLNKHKVLIFFVVLFLVLGAIILIIEVKYEAKIDLVIFELIISEILFAFGYVCFPQKLIKLKD